MTLRDPRLPADPELSPARRVLPEARLWGLHRPSPLVRRDPGRMRH